MGTASGSIEQGNVLMISRRTFSKALTAGFATASLAGLSSAQASVGATAARNVVLVHGAYADGSSWSDVIERLQAAGLNVTSVQNPLTSLADDVAATRRALARQEGPTVLAAHSWGGTVISEAGLSRMSPVWFTSPLVHQTSARTTPPSRRGSRSRLRIPESSNSATSNN